MNSLFSRITGWIVILFIAFCFASAAIAQDGGLFGTEGEGDLVWEDEFDGTGDPDVTKWERQEYNRRNNDNGPDGWWSREDSYLDGNGNLVIRVRKIENKNGDGDSCDYSVGALRSKGKFEKLYGKFEIRCKLPTQPGWWVAFWMMQGDVGSVENGGVDGTEVDIIEAFGWTNRVQFAFHWDGYGDAHKSIGKPLYPANIREGFHTFAMEWYPEMYVFFIDGKEYWRSEGGGVCNREGYIKVTGEISTEDWAINQWWAMDPAGATYPDSFVVDYVRVYEVGDYQYPAAVEGYGQGSRFELLPNPAGDRVTVQWDPGLFEGQPGMQITDMMGKVLNSEDNFENGSVIQVDGMDGGVYFISLNQKGTRVMQKLIKH
jgi:beta-glucanase (GH16 family)